MLSDLASEVAPVAAVVAPARVPLVIDAPKTVAPEKNVGAPSQDLAAAGGTNVHRKAIRESGTAQTPAVANVAKPARQPVDGSRKPRLKLAPLDMSAERDPVLRATNELLSVPSEDLQKRVEALAMWRALNASAQDVLRDEARMQAMESDVKRGRCHRTQPYRAQDVNTRLENRNPSGT